MSNISELLKLSIYFWQVLLRDLPLLSFLYHYSLVIKILPPKYILGICPSVSMKQLFGRLLASIVLLSMLCNFFSSHRIKKGNAQGQFDKFCYGFVTIASDEHKSNEIIAKISTEYPNWRMKIKDDNETRPDKYSNSGHHQPRNYQQNYQPQSMMPMPQQPMRPNYPNYNPNYVSNQNQNDKGEIFGEKTQRIMVRELWLGGIPEMMDHQSMSRIMSEFGMVEGTQIFPKFAFVKFKRAIDATNAYERAERIHQLFGNNNGFRISFSDPSRRKDIVANHYEFERNSNFLPILFLGFPPITSANIEINHMRNICQKFGMILNYYLKKSTNPQMRSYFLFTYESVKTAQKAKQELYRRKDLLGQKRVEMTLLLDEDHVLSGKDLNYIDKKFGPETGVMDKLKRPTYQPYVPPNYPNYPMNPYQNMQMNPPPMNNYHPYQNVYNQNQSMQYPVNNMYYDYPNQRVQESEAERNKEMFSLIQEVLDDKPKEKAKIPSKNEENDNENAADIISKMLGKDISGQKKEEKDENAEDHDHREREPGWSGFILWKGEKRAGVDGYLPSETETDFNEYSININSTISTSDITLKQKNNIMILQPSNSINEPAFKEYLKMLKNRIGVSVTKNWVIFVMGSAGAKEKVFEIKNNELLIVMEKLNIIPFIKDKIMPCEDFAD